MPVPRHNKKSHDRWKARSDSIFYTYNFAFCVCVYVDIVSSLSGGTFLYIERLRRCKPSATYVHNSILFLRVCAIGTLLRSTRCQRTNKPNYFNFLQLSRLSSPPRPPRLLPLNFDVVTFLETLSLKIALLNFRSTGYSNTIFTYPVSLSFTLTSP